MRLDMDGRLPSNIALILTTPNYPAISACGFNLCTCVISLSLLFVACPLCGLLFGSSFRICIANKILQQILIEQYLCSLHIYI